MCVFLILLHLIHFLFFFIGGWADYFWQLSEIVEDLKNDEPLLDSILMHMGSVYEKMEEFEMSFSSYSRALTIMEREYGGPSFVNLCIQ